MDMGHFLFTQPNQTRTNYLQSQPKPTKPTAHLTAKHIQAPI